MQMVNGRGEGAGSLAAEPRRQKRTVDMGRPIRVGAAKRGQSNRCPWQPKAAGVWQAGVIARPAQRDGRYIGAIYRIGSTREDIRNA